MVRTNYGSHIQLLLLHQRGEDYRHPEPRLESTVSIKCKVCLFLND